MEILQAEGVRIPAAGVFIEGDLRVPHLASGLVIFAHGSGSSRFSQRNRQVAALLQAHGYATLLLDLLTREEEGVEIVPGATHLFEEPGTLEDVCRLAAAWCARHLRRDPAI